MGVGMPINCWYRHLPRMLTHMF